tara:strand:+ start:1553 stop:1735 length:183 start_codon:yes stop_codon:yes gene_type:complete
MINFNQENYVNGGEIKNEKTNSTIMDMKKWQSWVKVAIIICIAFTVGYYLGSGITEWHLS